MGDLFRLGCECGYETDCLREGCGLAGACYALANCPTCRSIVSVQLSEGFYESVDVPLSCPRCGGNDLVLIDDPEGLSLCPRCGRHTLAAERAGLWD